MEGMKLARAGLINPHPKLLRERSPLMLRYIRHAFYFACFCDKIAGRFEIGNLPRNGHGRRNAKTDMPR